MALVPGYAHDVFISYAHVDDEPTGAATEGWVTTLFVELRKTINRKLGAADIWMDHDLSLHENVTSQLMDTIQKTAILVLVLSPGYLRSQWCQREKTAFLRQIDQGMSTGSRVFVIERDEVDREIRPAELKELIGHKFWAPGRPGDTYHTFCEGGLSERDPDYYEYIGQVNRLAKDLSEELTRLGTNKAPEQKVNAPCVYLAEATDELARIHEELSDYLDQLGVRVLPKRPYPRDDQEFRQAMSSDLAGCGIFVQILSGVRGRKVPEKPYGYPRMQYEIARGSGKVILQWREQGLAVDALDDEDQRQLLREMTVRAESIEDFKREIKRRLFEEPKQTKVRKSDGHALRALVFVDSDPDDWDLATQLSDRLKALGVDVSLPVWDQAPDAVRADLELNLTQCQALIVVYGKTTLAWVRSQLLGLYRKTVAQREQPLRALAVYQGPPDQKAKLNIEMHNLRVIDCTQGRAEEMDAQLQAFVQQLSSK